MYKNLVLYRNELKNKTIPKYKLIGIVTELIYSKKIFKRNKDIKTFVNDIFDIELKDYILKSRTMIVAKISKEIVYSENTNLYKSALNNFINNQINIIKKEGNIKDKKNEFDGWLK